MFVDALLARSMGSREDFQVTKAKISSLAVLPSISEVGTVRWTLEQLTNWNSHAFPGSYGSVETFKIDQVLISVRH